MILVLPDLSPPAAGILPQTHARRAASAPAPRAPRRHGTIITIIMNIRLILLTAYCANALKSSFVLPFNYVRFQGTTSFVWLRARLAVD